MFNKITKSAIILLGSVFFCGSLKAQTSELSNSYTYVQTNGGINLSSVYMDKYERGFKSGVNLGISVGHKFNTPVFLETGITFTQKGSKVIPVIQVVDSPNDEKFRWTETFNYVSFPIGIGLELGNKVKFRFQQSANFDMLVKAYAKYESGEFAIMPSETTQLEGGTSQILPYESQFKPFDISLSSSIGVKIPIGKFYIGSKLQSNFGLTSIHKNKSTLINDRLMVLSGNLSFGIRF